MALHAATVNMHYWWRNWMCATEWINVLDNSWRELCEEDDDDYRRLVGITYEIYFWTHEIEEGREQ